MESATSLMQMAKTAAKLAQLAEAKIPYISLCTDPTTGGVTASYAMLGDINIAEPKALIAFAGPRVVKDTTGKDLPEGFSDKWVSITKGIFRFYIAQKPIKEKYKLINIETTFQSRFGPQEWLTPYTDKTLEDLPKKGIKKVLVICPGFASDCVETLEEIDIQGRESFIENGGNNFDLIPCLNDNSDHINLFEKLVKKYI